MGAVSNVASKFDPTTPEGQLAILTGGGSIVAGEVSDALAGFDDALTGQEQRDAAKEAAQAQEAAALAGVDLARETRDLTFERLDPFYQAGLGSLDDLVASLSPGGFEQFQQEYLTSEPYQQRQENVIGDLSQSAAFSGTLGSGGAALDASNYLNKFAYDEAVNAYGLRNAGLQDLVGLSQFGATGQNQAGQNFTNQAIQGMNQAAQAQGAAAIAGASPGIAPYLQLGSIGAQIYGATV